MAFLLKHVIATSFLVKDIPGSRKQKQLSEEELEKSAAVYRKFKRTGTPAEVPGFCRIAKLDKEYVLTVPGWDSQEIFRPYNIGNNIGSNIGKNIGKNSQKFKNNTK